MPNIANHQSSKTTKALLLGDSGSGKTGSLCSLAAAGYNLRILDTDNGLDVVKNLLLDERSPYPKDSAERVQYVTLTDEMQVNKATGKEIIPGKLIPRKAEVWPKAMNLLAHWKDGETDLGPVITWGPQDVLVIDSLTSISKAAMNYVLLMNGRLGQQPYQSDWGVAQQLVEPFLQMLYDEHIKCNVIVICHITYIGEDNGPQRGYPASLGKALPPRVGQYFNTMLMAKSTGQGSGLKRKILTNVTGLIDLKNTAPLRVLPEYPLETGLAEYFKAVRG